MQCSLGKFKVSGTNLWMALVLMLYAGLACAADGLPWEQPLCGLANAFRGPTALAVGTIAFFAAGASFLWGEEIAGISKKLVTTIMAISIVIGGASFVGWIAAKMNAVAASCAM